MMPSLRTFFVLALATLSAACGFFVSFDDFDANVKRPPVLQLDGGDDAGGEDTARPVDPTVVAIAAGGEHTCALRRDGEVRCWGVNDHGQLGDGTQIARGAAVRVLGLPPATSIAAGGAHTCAVIEGGAVMCWGWNLEGNLGNASVGASVRPVKVKGVSNAIAVAAGGLTTCALFADGTVSCWGEHFDWVPQPINGVSGAKAIAVANYAGACALVSNGEVVCWRSTTDATKVTGVEGAVAIALGAAGACAVMQDGVLRCWAGYFEGGALYQASPVAGITSVTAVALRNAFDGDEICAVAGDSVWCWQRGQLPAPKAFLPAKAIVLGARHGCIQRSATSEVLCWGDDSRGQLGDGENASTGLAASGIPLDAPIALGDWHTCYAEGAGVRCFGSNTRGQLGDGTTTDSTTPVGVVDLGGSAASLGAGAAHTCAVVGAKVRCWGANDSTGYLRGQLGDGTFDDRRTPVDAVGITNAVAVSAGLATTCALLANGEVWCWGMNSYGQLGVSSDLKKFDPTPAKVPGIAGATFVSTGHDHACAIVSGGAVACWGKIGAPALSNAVSLASGDTQTCALLANGDVECFGPGGGGTKNAVSVGAGHRGGAIGNHSCAALATGFVSCWGSNFEGQLGDGTTNEVSFVDQVVGITNAKRVFAADARSCALVANGELRCWGLDPSTFRGSTVPVVVVGL